MSYHSMRIKKQLLINAENISNESDTITGIKRQSAFIFDRVSYNFLNKTYLNILDDKGYSNRLEKPHTYFKDGTKEMQSSNSSDALLMNIFCYPDMMRWKSLAKLLGIYRIEKPVFGWEADFINESKGHRTEIDMKIGNHIFEAKLTEPDFTKCSLDKVKGYIDYEKVFDNDKLEKNGYIEVYQLVRNILTAYKENFTFTLIVDERRTDLLREFIYTRDSIKIDELKNKIKFITWQEISFNIGKELKEYINKKYFYN